MTTLQELRGMSDKELQVELETTQKKVMEMTMKKSIGQLKETHELRGYKKIIAQIKTIQRELMRAEAERIVAELNA